MRVLKSRTKPGAWFAPFLTDVCLDALPIVWFRFIVKDGDLALQRCADARIDRTSPQEPVGEELVELQPASDQWFEDLNAKGDGNWGEFFEVDNYNSGAWLTFAIVHGIAPGQPFAARLSAETVMDFEGPELYLDATIRYIHPWSEFRVLRSWAFTCRQLNALAWIEKT